RRACPAILRIEYPSIGSPPFAGKASHRSTPAAQSCPTMRRHVCQELRGFATSRWLFPTQSCWPTRTAFARSSMRWKRLGHILGSYSKEALPPSTAPVRCPGGPAALGRGGHEQRSEERRVGKEC